MKAYIGLLYIAGVSVEDLWSPVKGLSIFRATISMQRFLFLSYTLRFDDKITRKNRQKMDCLAPCREIWDRFLKNCQRYYTFEYVTIDEQLLGFRGHCQFRIYISSKPDKYGLKIVMLNDAQTYYMYNAIPYVGKVETQPNESVPSYYVQKLTEPIQKTNRNVTVDNWFSLVPLFEDMFKKGLTMVGTLRKNKPEVPGTFVAKGQVGSSRFAFDKTKTLVSYTPKKNKVVLLLSTLHHDDSIDPDTGKPEIIISYNKTKGGTDSFDQLCHAYTTARKTRRWPQRFFFGMLDQAGVNAAILHGMANWQNKLPRKDFIFELGFSLVKPWMEDRIQNVNLSRPLKQIIRQVLGHASTDLPENRTPLILDKRIRCSFCDRSKDKKTKLLCSDCQRAICDEHRSYKCVEC